MADTFLTTKQNAGQHLRNLFADGDLAPESVVKDSFWATQQLRGYLVKGFALAADTWRGAVLLR
ncbi:hypothetical protein C3R74_09200 [Acidithiobacillus ferridurans]|uniref:hypothetical protein n=1 Tax=Acidithiobacillus ferridurans TaxID=1232575 RepID=UPI000DE34F42|nr:hypothetical protein [Acidithiobacillus ferridurans]MBU2720828.1 virulence RhuM family protein [Acidithiobacillus ferridurans]MBU2803737.1 virulence RhuM family protein [Acidithiobacillus ferridurans]RBM00382.1 hypothetical protein C3R74_09200 [Acidithiobacillus ferridurans]